MRVNKLRVAWFILGFLVIAGWFYSWSIRHSPAPQREFLTSELLITDLPGWVLASGPEDRPGHDFYLKGATGGSTVVFLKPPSGIGPWRAADAINGLWEQIADMSQWVVKFSTIDFARQAYKEHYWIVDKPKPLQGLEYGSELADQFRIVCDPRQRLVTACDIEGQYEEFYVLIRYSSINADNREHLIQEMKSIALATDAKMRKFLGTAR